MGIANLYIKLKCLPVTTEDMVWSNHVTPSQSISTRLFCLLTCGGVLLLFGIVGGMVRLCD